MKRTNEFEVVPQSDEDEELFRRLLDASAALWNEINYQRRTNFDDPDGDVWEIDEYRGRYGGTLGSSTVQQIERKNRGVALVLRTQRKGRSQRQARLLGQPRRGARTADIHPKHVVLGRMGRTLPARNSCWPRPERGVRSWIPRTASARGSGRSELEGVRQTGPVGTVLRRCERDVQGLSASHNRQFSTGTPTGGRNCRSGHRRKQYRRLYGFDWRSVPVRGPRPVQAVPRDYATDRRTAIEAPRRPVQFEANQLTVSTPDATARPCNGRARSRPDRTVVRRGRFNGVCRRSHRRTRDTLVGSDEH